MDHGKLQRYMNGEWPTKRKDVEEHLRAYYDLKESLGEKEGMLYRDGNTEMWDKLIRLSHGGHPGMEAKKRRLKELFWWPKMNSDTDNMVRHCQPCQESGKSTKPGKVPVTAVPNEFRQQGI